LNDFEIQISISGDDMTGNNLEEIELKFATRLVNSGPVVMISAAHGQKKAVMTVAWNMPVQKEPPLIAIGVGKGHHTTSIIELSGEFIINVPDYEMLDVVRYCGSVSGYDEDKFGSGRFEFARGRKVEAPLLTDAAAVLECTVDRKIELDKLNIYLGKVVRCAARKDCFDGTWKVSEGKVSLVHHLGGPNFYSLMP